MLKEVRHSRIRDLLDERGQLRVSEINTSLDVSEATIRRDLDELALQGLIRRTHGGAMRAERAAPEPPLRMRKTTHADEKARIAASAATLVGSGDTIFLGTGTTVAAIVPHLLELDGLRVITNSLPVIIQLAEFESIELLVVGGLFRHSEGSMISSLADEAILRYRADHVMMGIRGVDANHGLTNSSVAEATTDRTILTIAEHRVILADHSKFGQVDSFVVAPIEEVSTIVTSAETDQEMLDAISTRGVEALIAEEVASW